MSSGLEKERAPDIIAFLVDSEMFVQRYFGAQLEREEPRERVQQALRYSPKSQPTGKFCKQIQGGFTG